MIVYMKVPDVGESIQEVEIAQWFKQEGEWVEQDEEIVEIDSEKASLPIASPVAGRIVKIVKQDGDIADIGDVIAEIDDAAKREEGEAVSEPADSRQPPSDEPQEEVVAAKQPPPFTPDERDEPPAPTRSPKTGDQRRRFAEPVEPTEQAARPVQAGRQEEVVPMSRIRRRIAARLVEAQQQSALLTTFNEIDMSAVIELRRSLRQTFQEHHGVRLGFMSFFVKSAIEALKRCPEINAEIRGDDVVFRNYYDIGIAIGGGKGLVVPVLRDADQLSVAEVESAIDDFANRAGNNRLRPKELIGGTFTISNGGIYGSLLSTPIVNPPQSGVLGMHVIQDRPVAREGQVVIRPMMYVALTYDHRIVDGREAVGCLRRIKELVEEPTRILLEV